MLDTSARDVCVNTCDPAFAFLYVLIENRERDIYVLNTLDECIVVPEEEGKSWQKEGYVFEILTVGECCLLVKSPNISKTPPNFK